ncbi:MAG: hypothetical protein C0467_14830 [Planctomycetaceae bacterium]|nr:hypothetical protein [Planctomycetaceae bacterium]
MSGRQIVWAALVVLGAVSLPGCGGGVERHSVSGAVTLGGQPVPAGEITFEPDASKGNNGPGSVARIRNGRYQTEPGLGLVGGPYIARIIPMSGTPFADSLDGKPLLPSPHVESVEFPPSIVTRDFGIPAAGKKPPG